MPKTTRSEVAPNFRAWHGVRSRAEYDEALAAKLPWGEIVQDTVVQAFRSDRMQQVLRLRRLSPKTLQTQLGCARRVAR